MKPRERVIATLYHEEPDLIPCLWAVASGLRELEKEVRKLGINLPNDVIGLGSSLEWKLKKKTGEYEIFETPFGSEVEISYKVKYGYKKLVKPLVKKPEDIELIGIPNIEDFVHERIIQLRKLSKTYSDYFLLVSHTGVVESVFLNLRRFSDFLIDLVVRRNFAKKLIELAIKPYIEATIAILEEVEVDGVFITDDMGDSKRLFFSPEIYKDVILPWHEYIVREYHKRGAFVFLHAHGNLNPILPDIIKARFDVINPLDASEGMDLKFVKEKFGDKITLMPQPSTYILERISRLRNFRRAIREYLEEQIRIGAPGGGFIYYGVIVDMPIESVVFYVELFKKLRKYPIKSNYF